MTESRVLLVVRPDSRVLILRDAAAFEDCDGDLVVVSEAGRIFTLPAGGWVLCRWFDELRIPAEFPADWIVLASTRDVGEKQSGVRSRATQ
jgi:hypothetical protein